jgi:preprotein translocase subunit SecG
MFILVAILHVVLCIALILIVLLQTGKGSDLASAFGGGGSQAMFGGRGPSSFLNRSTTIVAVMFMVTSMTLAYMSAGKSSSVMGDLEEPPAVEETQDVSTEETVDPEAAPVPADSVPGGNTEDSGEQIDPADAPAPDAAAESDIDSEAIPDKGAQ